MNGWDIRESGGQRPRLMVAEDDVEMAHVFRFLFEREGFDVHVVRDGREAVECIRKAPPPAFVLVDVMMPFVNGFQVVRTLRESSSWASVPVIMVSGKAAEEDVVEAIEAGADDYVTKPVRPKELIARVRGLLQRRSASRVA